MYVCVCVIVCGLRENLYVHCEMHECDTFTRPKTNFVNGEKKRAGGWKEEREEEEGRKRVNGETKERSGGGQGIDGGRESERAGRWRGTHTHKDTSA